MNAALGAGVPFDSAVAEATQRVQEWLKRGIVELCGAKKLRTHACSG